jgi:hypothetical protein
MAVSRAVAAGQRRASSTVHPGTLEAQRAASVVVFEDGMSGDRHRSFLSVEVTFERVQAALPQQHVWGQPAGKLRKALAAQPV